MFTGRITQVLVVYCSSRIFTNQMTTATLKQQLETNKILQQQHDENKELHKNYYTYV